MQMNSVVRDPPPPRYNGGDCQSRLESRLLFIFYSMNDHENAYKRLYDYLKMKGCTISDYELRYFCSKAWYKIVKGHAHS